jgi:hypothetical protein
MRNNLQVDFDNETTNERCTQFLAQLYFPNTAQLFWLSDNKYGGYISKQTYFSWCEKFDLFKVTTITLTTGLYARCFKN